MKKISKKTNKQKKAEDLFLKLFFPLLGSTLIKCSITIIMCDLAVAVVYLCGVFLKMKNILLISSFYLCSLLVTHFSS